jgi:hypothetical protein
MRVPAVPRVDDFIKDANIRYYRVESVTYHPFEQNDYPKVLITVSESYEASPAGRRKDGPAVLASPPRPPKGQK